MCVFVCVLVCMSMPRRLRRRSTMENTELAPIADTREVEEMGYVLRGRVEKC